MNKEKTNIPAEETQAPAEETQAPAEETQAPAEETQAPAEETQAPAEETKDAPKKKGKANDPMEEKVSFTAPFDPTGKEQDIILSVNGETIRIKRGATVEIKRKFLEVYQNSEAQRNAAHAVMEAAAKGGAFPLAEI